MGPRNYNQLLFEQWAPPGSLWTAWAKPVLFAQLTSPFTLQRPDPPLQPVEVPWAPPADQQTVIIIDLPAAASVLAGLSLAAVGYRPVPLYNCCTSPAEVIDLQPITGGLRSGGQVLAEAKLPPDAPPAFLLDSRRVRGERPAMPGSFDNRWIVLPQDFPSAGFLASHGLHHVLLVQSGTQPASDLSHVLLRWQRAGMVIRRLDIAVPQSIAEPIVVPKPSWFRDAWYVLLATIGLRRNSAGGFGSVVPLPSSG